VRVVGSGELEPWQAAGFVAAQELWTDACEWWSERQNGRRRDDVDGGSGAGIDGEVDGGVADGRGDGGGAAGRGGGGVRDTRGGVGGVAVGSLGERDGDAPGGSEPPEWVSLATPRIPRVGERVRAGGVDWATRWVRVGDLEVQELERDYTGERYAARPGAATCGVPIARGALAGRRCPRAAGQGTAHLGAGSCVAHGGAKRAGRATGAWLMAHAFGTELDINPWDALLKAVRIAAGKVAYIEWVLSRAQSDLELEGRAVRVDSTDRETGGRGRSSDAVALLLHPDTGEPLGVGEYRDLSWWVQKGELWHDRMARTAKMAIDAGVAVWQVQQIEQQAQVLARVLNAVIDGVEGVVSEETVAEMRRLMRNELLQIEVEERRRDGALGDGDPDRGAVDSTWTGELQT
jgi:hypothetical protein